MRGRVIETARHSDAPAGVADVAARIPAERDRAVGQLTAQEVRSAIARYLTPSDVADLTRAAIQHDATSPVLAQLRAGWRCCAAQGVICTTTRSGLAVEIGDRGAVVPWPLVARVVADGTTPDRLTALERAIAGENSRAVHAAAAVIVLAGPAATQLDLLDTLTAFDEHQAPTGDAPTGKPGSTPVNPRAAASQPRLKRARSTTHPTN